MSDPQKEPRNPAWLWMLVGTSLRTAITIVPLVVLLSVWINTERMYGIQYIQNLFLLMVLLAIVFFADALEVAYSLLRYKLLDQFSGTTAWILGEMHKNEDLVYEAR